MAANLEKRVEALERELRTLKAAVKNTKAKELWWERLAGAFTDDPLFDEMVEAGREYRRSTRHRANGHNS
jgi:hypothetical protein